MNKKDIARESKKIKKNARLQVTKCGRGYNAYIVSSKRQLKDTENEKTLGFITEPMTQAQVYEWLDKIENAKPVFKRKPVDPKVKRIKALFGK